MKCILLFLSIVLTLFYKGAYAIDIRFEKTITLSEKVLLRFPISFCVTEEEMFLVSDIKAGDIKIYNPKGELEKVLGSRGAGPNEFLQPLFCYYSKGMFIIPDVGQRKIFIYKKIDKTTFKRIEGISCLDPGEDFYLSNDILFMAGNKLSDDDNYYSLYSFNIDKKNDYNYFLTSYVKYSLSSNNEYKTKIFANPDITTIGPRGMFDVQGDFAYFVWEGDLKVFKINLKTKEIITFGKKMPHFVKPYTNPKLNNAFFNREGNVIGKERRKMSYLIQIFAAKNHVLVIYTMPTDTKEENDYMVQFYKPDGDFVKELVLPGKGSSIMCFDKENAYLYAMGFEDNEKSDESHRIIKYKIQE